MRQARFNTLVSDMIDHYNSVSYPLTQDSRTREVALVLANVRNGVDIEMQVTSEGELVNPIDQVCVDLCEEYGADYDDLNRALAYIEPVLEHDEGLVFTNQSDI